ncbi:hypothetical protein NBZ79_16820 [Sneathiella marina]|uniref:Uncharacterized protein n=1 Tax=Sneathiella marina TaxID=2950108 RepID=A0ABY4W1S7_9PROT|nr:hypothetical protein [Sneathiella marina]USG60824.1 hypothetical protein NBZ79_16820 [Sneathiella marina]
MRFPPQQIARFFKFAAIGAMTGIVFSIIFLVLPAAGLLFAVNAFGLDWDMRWVPSVGMIMAMGAICGAIFAAGLFIKDQYRPYVEEVPDFEADAEDPDFDDFR